ncbi:MAG: hypothetical protein EKK57_04930 [Proteobacteria bacterium]|nr:MAG: hypothetical protein EKK57_04930 [Pseudomonadota bacterium]
MSAIQKIVARKGKDCNLYGKCYYAKHINYTTKNGSIVKMKSGWEVKVAKYLDDNNISWEYEKQTFPIIYTYEGQTKDGTYTPDFFLTNEIWEIKGYWRKDAQIKYETFKLQYPDIKIRLFREKELKELGIKLWK